MVLLNVAMTISDIPKWIPHGAMSHDVYHTMLVAGSAAYYVFFDMLLCAFFFYECEYVSKAIKIPLIVQRCMAIFSVGVGILILVAMPFGLFFSVSDTDYVSMGIMYPLLLGSYIIQELFCLYVPLRTFTSMRTKEMVFIFAYAIFPILALAFQSIYETWAIQNIANTLALLLAYINVQTESNFRNQQKQAENLTHVLVESIEAKDLYTKGHSARVAKYTYEIAYRMGYNQQQLRNIYLVALLHDVGKMGIPDAIINKNGRLTDEEIRVIRRHPKIGASILKEFPQFAEGALYHHERYDGKGYPEGLAGHKIPETARIIAVADSYDAMTSNRSYRRIMEQQDVRREIIRGMGTQFDPRVADIMVDIIDEDTEYKNRQHADESNDLYLS